MRNHSNLMKMSSACSFIFMQFIVVFIKMVSSSDNSEMIYFKTQQPPVVLDLCLKNDYSNIIHILSQTFEYYVPVSHLQHFNRYNFKGDVFLDVLHL